MAETGEVVLGPAIDRHLAQVPANQHNRVWNGVEQVC